MDREALLAAVEQTQQGGLAVLTVLKGYDTIPALQAIFAAATSLIETSYAPEHRFTVLAGVLLPFTEKWSAGADSPLTWAARPKGGVQ